MSKEYEDIRLLAYNIEQIAREHQVWSASHEVVYTATNHLRAIAQYMEYREKLEEEKQALEKERNKSFAQYLKENFFRGLFNGE